MEMVYDAFTGEYVTEEQFEARMANADYMEAKIEEWLQEHEN